MEGLAISKVVLTLPLKLIILETPFVAINFLLNSHGKLGIELSRPMDATLINTISIISTWQVLKNVVNSVPMILPVRIMSGRIIMEGLVG